MPGRARETESAAKMPSGQGQSANERAGVTHRDEGHSGSVGGNFGRKVDLFATMGGEDEKSQVAISGPWRRDSSRYTQTFFELIFLIPNGEISKGTLEIRKRVDARCMCTRALTEHERPQPNPRLPSSVTAPDGHRICSDC